MPTGKGIPWSQTRNKRRNTDSFKAEIGGFSGYPRIIQAYENSKINLGDIAFLGLFVLGCRANELPTLKRSQIDLGYSKENIFIKGMAVEKHKDVIWLKNPDGSPQKDGDRKLFKFKSKKGFRSFPLRKDEPMVDVFIKYIEQYNPNQYVFPLKYNQIYQNICMIENTMNDDTPKRNWVYYKGEWYPHRLRSERCCCLIKSFGYNTERLKKFFGWDSEKTANTYSDIQAEDLAVKGKVDYS
jgi:integrase